jgi:autotransporter-associated beta strand protein
LPFRRAFFVEERQAGRQIKVQPLFSMRLTLRTFMVALGTLGLGLQAIGPVWAGQAGTPIRPDGRPIIELDGGTLRWDNGYNADLSSRLVLGGGQISTLDTGTNQVVLSLPMAVNGLGRAGLIKSGSGVLDLRGNNTYQGPTTVAAGVLLANGSLAPASTVTVASGATLGGDGTIGGPVFVLPGGELTPQGAFPATLRITNRLQVEGNLAFRVSRTEVPASPNSFSGQAPGVRVVLRSDQLSGITAAVLGGSLDLGLGPGSDALSGGERFILVQAAECGGRTPLAGVLPGLGSSRNWWLGDLVQNGTVRVNRWPVAADHPLRAEENTAATIAAASLLANDFDADGDALDLIRVGSPRHGAASLAAGTVSYVPAVDYTGSDRFTYWVSDDHGGTATAMVQVDVAPGQGVALRVVSGPTVRQGSFVVELAGIPGFTYSIEYSEKLSPANWLLRTNRFRDVCNG